jgi:predicted ribosomally synthesized peptide with nif11-like leader
MTNLTQNPLQAMPQEQLKGFLEAIQADVILQEKLQAISSTSGEDQSVTDDEYDEAIFAVAKESGFIISAEDLKSLRTEIEVLEGNDGELTDKQLEDVAGGAAFIPSAATLATLATIKTGVAITGGLVSIGASLRSLFRRR